ncbi:MAG TPA: hypothetical protein VJW17_05300 [Pyrinomonadaceae bacterium]|nr:hypothetical protein [Pyrinomonadaceae bacterium]
MHTVDLSANVPLYGQEQCNYCGAACGQMARNGYPNAADRLFYAQVNVWNVIQANNSTLPADSAWATDPHGLTACMNLLSNPAGVHWAEFADANQNVVLFDILFWMNRRHYPSPVLINRGGHWINIVGYVTDVEPVAGSSPVLQSISVNDPEPHNVGTSTTFSAAQWFGGPWNGDIMYSGTWFGKYVAVVEPPIEGGKVVVKRAKRTGTNIIKPEEARRSAEEWLRQFRAEEQQPQHSFLLREDVRAMEPLLVREGVSRRAKTAPHYYIVPFTLANDFAEHGSPVARACVLVNAYTGAFEEVTTFGRPVRYLTREDALAVVASALQKNVKDLAKVDASLMFEAGDITHIRSYPFWRIDLGRRTLYVDQVGKLYGKFLPAIPGD